MLIKARHLTKLTLKLVVEVEVVLGFCNGLTAPLTPHPPSAPPPRHIRVYPSLRMDIHLPIS